jgi:hypothetical protein
MVVENSLDDAKAGVVWIQAVDASDTGALSKAVHNGRSWESAVVRPHQGWWDVWVELVKSFLFFQHHEVWLAERVHTLLEWLT